MPRPISWVPRLHEISHSVANSVRLHYGRRNIEQLFELQPRTAQKLIEMVAGVQIGTSWPYSSRRSEREGNSFAAEITITGAARYEPYWH